MHNRRGQLCEEHRCADIYRCPREFGDGPRWHYSLQRTDEYSPHTCNPRQRRRRRHPSDSLQDRVRHRQKGAGEVARAIPGYRTGRSLRGIGRRVRNPYGLAASLFASLRTPAVGPRLRHLLYRLHTGFLGGSRAGGARGPPMRFRRISRARRPGLRHAHRRAHDIGEYQQRWGPCVHMGAHKQSRVHVPNEGVQQGRIKWARSANPLVAIWPTMSTAQTSICDAPSCITMYRPGAALASKSLCTLAAGETSRRTRPKSWWWRCGPPRHHRLNRLLAPEHVREGRDLAR